MKPVHRDLLFSLVFGILALLFLHFDHLVNSFSSWDDPAWWLHLLVDGGYVLVYGSLAWVALRGWRVWQKSKR